VSRAQKNQKQVKNLMKKIVISRGHRIGVLEKEEWHADCSCSGGVWRIEPRRAAEAVGKGWRTGSRSFVMASRRSGGTERGKTE
jgi:hypothetical protein